MSSMNYISTRGGCPPKKFSQILIEGLAPDGGLYMPAYYPQVDSETFKEWSKFSYKRLAYEILSLYIDDIPHDDLNDIVCKSYSKLIFGSDDITPVRMLSYPGFFIQDLSNGPTLAFKDIAMRLLLNLLEYELERRGEELTILVGTSGDTGTAVINAALGKRRIRVIVLSPYGRMSPFQTAQMYGMNEANIFNIAIEGSFDNCQEIVKLVFKDAEFKSKYKLGAANSINWARRLAQIVYYFYGYFQVAINSNSPMPISFAVPTGNFGNIYAGHAARMMGLPIYKLLLATNENDVLDQFFKSGHYGIRNETVVTSSQSQDICKASNLEAFIFDLLNRDTERVSEMFTNPEGFTLSDAEFQLINKYGFLSGKVTHAERLDVIKFVYQHYRNIIDPHTANAVALGYSFYQARSTSVICLETAKAVKFSETILEAIGKSPERPKEFEGIESKPQYFTKMEPDVNLVKEFIRNHC